MLTWFKRIEKGYHRKCHKKKCKQCIMYNDVRWVFHLESDYLFLCIATSEQVQFLVCYHHYNRQRGYWLLLIVSPHFRFKYAICNVIPDTWHLSEDDDDDEKTNTFICRMEFRFFSKVYLSLSLSLSKGSCINESFNWW